MKTPVASTEHPVLGLPTPRIFHLLFKTTAFAWLWLIVRAYLAYQWIMAGWGKVTNPAWVETGAALKGFWTAAVAVPENGRPVIAYDWYRSFIGFMLDQGWYTWFAKLVAYGELLVGIGLLLGAVVAVSAFFGALMNWNYIMAGSASTNGLMLVLSVLLIVSWRVAGWYGLDRWLLPRLHVYLRPARDARPVVSPSTS